MAKKWIKLSICFRFGSNWKPLQSFPPLWCLTIRWRQIHPRCDILARGNCEIGEHALTIWGYSSLGNIVVKSTMHVLEFLKKNTLLYLQLLTNRSWERFSTTCPSVEFRNGTRKSQFLTHYTWCDLPAIKSIWNALRKREKGAAADVQCVRMTLANSMTSKAAWHQKWPVVRWPRWKAACRSVCCLQFTGVSDKCKIHFY